MAIVAAKVCFVLGFAIYFTGFALYVVAQTKDKEVKLMPIKLMGTTLMIIAIGCRILFG